MFDFLNWESSLVPVFAIWIRICAYKCVYTGHTCGEKLLVTAFLGSYVHHKFYYNHWGYISLLKILVLLIISSGVFLTIIKTQRNKCRWERHTVCFLAHKYPLKTWSRTESNMNRVQISNTVFIFDIMPLIFHIRKSPPLRLRYYRFER